MLRVSGTHRNRCSLCVEYSDKIFIIVSAFVYGNNKSFLHWSSRHEIYLLGWLQRQPWEWEAKRARLKLCKRCWRMSGQRSSRARSSQLLRALFRWKKPCLVTDSWNQTHISGKFCFLPERLAEEIIQYTILCTILRLKITMAIWKLNQDYSCRGIVLKRNSSPCWNSLWFCWSFHRWQQI